jgi:hypothetical protein
MSMLVNHGIVRMSLIHQLPYCNVEAAAKKTLPRPLNTSQNVPPVCGK